MNSPDELSEEERLISMAAAEWIVRRDSGFNPADQDRYFEWLAADPRHGEWVARHQKTWQRFDPLLGDQESVAAGGLFLPALEEPHPKFAARAGKAWLAPAGWAIAAVLVIAAFSSFRSAEGVNPGTLASNAVSSTGPQSEHRLLDDGSMVELNRGAAIAVDFSAGLRRVRLLRGEAYFTVAHDASRPFVVQAKDVSARALGTVFNVRLENDTIEVLVTEGRVHVEKAEAADDPALRSPAAAPATPQPVAEKASLPAQVVLEAGQRAVVGREPEDEPIQVLKVSANDMERLLSWQTRLLDFSSAPLAEVVAEFNRHNLSKLVIADDSLNTLPIVASFRADNVEGFLRLLEITADVKVDRHPGRIVLRRSQ